MPDKTPDRPRIFLNNVHLKGSKSIEDLSIDFQKGLNILIGKNGSGKSNFMEFLFQVIGLNRNRKYSFNYAKLEFNSNDNHSFIIELKRQLQIKTDKSFGEDRLSLSEKLLMDGQVFFDNSNNEDDKNNLQLKNQKIFYRGNLPGLFGNLGYQGVYPLYVKFDLPANLECVSAPGTFKINFESSLVIWDDRDTISLVDDIIYNLEMFYDDESNKIRDIKKEDVLNQLKVKEKIIENLKVYTSIEDVRFSSNINIYRDEKSIIIDNIKIEFKLNGNWLPWSQLSDGTKRLFYIISEVTNSNGLVLIEEPELGIHPHQFNLLMDFLKEQSEQKQIIISTHSPKALDHLSQDELSNILLTYYDLKKGTQIRHLTKKEVAKAKRYMKEVGFFSDYWLLSDLEE